MSAAPPGSEPPATPLEELSDAELLAAHVAGDAAAFGVLFARHRDRLWAVALRTTGHPEDAADGLQDGLIAAYRRAGSFRGEAAVTTWLHRVVVNACLDRMRAARVRRTEPLPDDPDVASRAGRDRPRASDPADRADPADPADPADIAVREDRRRQVLAALSQLPPEQRAALVLVDMEGYPVAEAAAVLDCAVGTVKSRCSRGRARLAVLLELLGPEQAGAGSGTRGDPGNRPATTAVPSPSTPRAPPAGSA